MKKFVSINLKIAVTLTYIFFLNNYCFAKVIEFEDKNYSQTFQNHDFLESQFTKFRSRSYDEIGARTTCEFGRIKSNCFENNGEFILEFKIPVIPTKLAEFIQTGDVGNGSFSINNFKIERKIEFFKFKGQYEYINFIDTDWAMEKYIFWTDVEKSRFAGSLLKLWIDLEKKTRAEPLGTQGFFMARVINKEKAISESIQLCWMFLSPFDPDSSKCTAVAIKRNGKYYVPFLAGYYNGGYSFEPDYGFSCTPPPEGANDETDFLEKAFINELLKSPNLYRIEYIKNRKTRFDIRFKKMAEKSTAFPGWREFSDVRIFGLASDGDYSMELTFDFYITKQNISEMQELNQPSDEQNKYYGEFLVSQIEKSGYCSLFRYEE